MISEHDILEPSISEYYNSAPNISMNNRITDPSGIQDLVPHTIRQQWVKAGYYPNQTIYQLFVNRCQQHPDKPAIISNDLMISYQKLLNNAQSLAAAFAKMGIVAGDVVAYQLSNQWQCCVIDLATAAIGAIVAPLPPGRGALEMELLLNRCSARTLIVECNVTTKNRTTTMDATAEKNADTSKTIEMIQSLRPTTLSLRFPIAITHNSKAKHNSTTDNITYLPSGWQSFESLLNTPPMVHYPNVSPDSPARLLVSSGTESEPKLVAYSHNALIGGRARFLQRLLKSGTKSDLALPEFRALYLVPLGSAFGSTATVGALAFLGGSLVLIPQFDVSATINAISRFKPSHLLGVPTMFQRIAADPTLKNINKSSLVSLIAGGALIDTKTIRHCEQAFGCAFINLYGSADGVNCHNCHDDIPDAVYYSVGRPFADICDIRIVDNQGNSLPCNTVGEIYARGPITPMQYVNAPHLDKQYRNKHGWVYTGDRGKIDDQGYLILEGRKKDIIIRGGVNISPAQIENVVSSHPDVISNACIALADADLGQRIALCVSLIASKPLLSLNAVNKHLLNCGLEKNKLPEYLIYYKQLPLNPAGKIDKKLLTQEISFLSTSLSTLSDKSRHAI